MIPELFVGVLGNVIAGLPTKACTEFAYVILTNRKALAFATEKLRFKYENAVHPASYDAVVSNFQVTRQDFIDYFSKTQTPTVEGLGNYMREQLKIRAIDWVYNSPTNELFNQMIDDFTNTYASYFITVDPHLLSLHIMGATNEIKKHLSILSEQIAEINRTFKKSKSTHKRNITKDILTILVISQIPYEILEQSKNRVDIALLDTTGAFPSKIFVSALNSINRIAVLDTLSEHIKLYGYFNHAIIVTIAEPTSDLILSAIKRGMDLKSLNSFSIQMQRIATAEPYVIGSVSSKQLQETLTVDNLFVEPQCIKLSAQEAFMQDRTDVTRLNVIDCIDSFMNDQSKKVLAILGGYGSGKSALCAHLMTHLEKKDKLVQPIYLSLNKLNESEGLTKVVSKADRIARAISGSACTVVVILDGLDELPNAMHPLEKRNNVLRIIEATHHTDKIILTARTTYFRGLSDFWRLFARENEAPLWDRIISSLPENRQRPGLLLLILQDFNNDQINKYMDNFGTNRVKNDSFSENLKSSLIESDPFGIYRRICRCPLFLFLLTNTQPWKDKTVECIGDVLKALMRYWLERDIEKGASRWQFTTSDRMQFVDELAWWMHNRNKLMLTFVEYDQFVNDFTKYNNLPHEELSLDLQTTGFFSLFANNLHFALLEFMDTIVAQRYAFASFQDAPNNLPKGNAIKILLGFIETNQYDKYGWEFSSDAFIKDLNIDVEEYDKPINISPKGIIYQIHTTNSNWHNINSHSNKNLRAIINAALDDKGIGGPPYITILISNALGIHARPASFVVQAAQRCKSNISLRKEGAIANAKSIMDVMMLAATGGSVIHVLYEKDSDSDVEVFLNGIHATKAPFGSPWQWEVNFSEAYL